MSFRVYLCHDEPADHSDALTRAERALPEPDRARLAGITAPHRRREFVLGRRLAYFALADTLGAAPWALSAERGHRPRARTPDGREHRALNLSHSRGWLACAITDDPATIPGCDLEAIRARSESSWRRLADLGRDHPVFDGDARRWILAAGEGGDAGRDVRLALAWTLAEAVAKGTGYGIFRGPSRHLASASALSDLEGVASAHPERFVPLGADADGWHRWCCRLGTHWLAVARRAAEPPTRVPVDVRGLLVP